MFTPKKLSIASHKRIFGKYNMVHRNCIWLDSLTTKIIKIKIKSRKLTYILGTAYILRFPKEPKMKKNKQLNISNRVKKKKLLEDITQEIQNLG